MLQEADGHEDPTEFVSNGTPPLRPLSATSSPTNGKVAGKEVATEPQSPNSTSVGPTALSSSVTSIIKTPTPSRGFVHDSASADNALEAALQEAVRAEAESQNNEGLNVDKNTSYAPDADEISPISPVVDQQRSPSYSPVLHRESRIVEAEIDEYEPPEATPPLSPTPVNQKDHIDNDDLMQDMVVEPAVESISDRAPQQSSRDDDLELELFPGHHGRAPQLIEVLSMIILPSPRKH